MLPAVDIAGNDTELGLRDFRRICELVRVRTGISLGDGKRQLCQTRLARRLRALGLRTFGEYVALFDDDAHPEHRELVNAITTNVTAFFREDHHFATLASHLPALAARQRRIRIWSAGCSSGEEPWSIAMVVREALGDTTVDVKILATDIDTEVLGRARAGLYRDELLEPVAVVRRQRFFARGTGANAGWWRVADELRPLVTFKPLNLFDAWPMRGPFDVIFCRNVIIYFDAPNKAELLGRYRDLLAPEGYLFLGHSETITAAVSGFRACGRTTYQRVP